MLTEPVHKTLSPIADANVPANVEGDVTILRGVTEAELSRARISYDTRVEISSIFFLVDDTHSSGGRFVTGRPCLECIRKKQFCNRGRPMCMRCKTPDACVPQSTDYCELPPPQQRRGRNRSKTNAMESGTVIVLLERPDDNTDAINLVSTK